MLISDDLNKLDSVAEQATLRMVENIKTIVPDNQQAFSSSLSINDSILDI